MGHGMSMNALIVTSQGNSVADMKSLFHKEGKMKRKLAIFCYWLAMKIGDPVEDRIRRFLKWAGYS